MGRLMALMARFASSVPLAWETLVQLFFNRAPDYVVPGKKAARTRRRNRSRSVLFIFEAGDFPLISSNDCLYSFVLFHFLSLLFSKFEFRII